MMLLRKWLLLLLMLASGAQTRMLSAQQNKSDAWIWRSANTLYQQCQYAAAKEEYLKLLDARSPSADVLYNLGNTCYQLNDFPEAVLYFQKALQLRPTDKKIKQNLLLTQQKLELPHEKKAGILTRFWQSLNTPAAGNIWAMLSLIFFTSFLTVIFLKRLEKIRYAGRWMSATIVSFLICLSLSFTSFRAASHSGAGVVMQECALLTAPSMESKVQGKIQAGTTVIIVSSEKGYLRVELTNGLVGWLQSNQLREI